MGKFLDRGASAVVGIMSPAAKGVITVIKAMDDWHLAEITPTNPNETRREAVLRGVREFQQATDQQRVLRERTAAESAQKPRGKDNTLRQQPVKQIRTSKDKGYLRPDVDIGSVSNDVSLIVIDVDKSVQDKPSHTVQIGNTVIEIENRGSSPISRIEIEVDRSSSDESFGNNSEVTRPSD